MAAFAAASMAIGLLGCGMAASPQPPSLGLPKPVHDLAAARVGNHVTLTWTSPRQTTDRLRVKIPVTTRVCRQVNTFPCVSVASVAAAPGGPAKYTDSLPVSLTAGPLRAITYRVFALNRHGRSAGPSNAAMTLAGEAPPAIEDLAATATEQGVLLRWSPAASMPYGSIQLRRTLVTSMEIPRKPSGAVLPVAAEPAELILAVPATSQSGALDTSILFGRHYRYMAARIEYRTVDGKRLRIIGAESRPVDIEPRDTFPPAVPTGLVGVPVPASMNDGKPAVDLSWFANAEPDLARYRVYRRDTTAGTAGMQVGPDSIVAPSFRDEHAVTGHMYAYTVSAVDKAGNQSGRSTPVTVTVP